MTEPYGDMNTADQGGSIAIQTINNLQMFVANVVNNYFELNSDKYFDDIKVKKNMTDPDKYLPVIMYVSVLSPDENQNLDQLYRLTPDNLGPLDWDN